MYACRETLILASGSPRRSEMLASCGIPFIKEVSDAPETVVAGESPKDMVERLAQLKASVVAKNFPDAWVLGADTTVVVDGSVLGKPSDRQEAALFLSRLQGRTHEVWGAFALLHDSTGSVVVRSDVSRVTMIPLADDEIQRYIDSGEPMDKAGAYAIQGIGASLIHRVEGSYTNVVGLDLSALIAECKRLGILAVK